MELKKKKKISYIKQKFPILSKFVLENTKKNSKKRLIKKIIMAEWKKKIVEKMEKAHIIVPE